MASNDEDNDPAIATEHQPQLTHEIHPELASDDNPEKHQELVTHRPTPRLATILRLPLKQLNEPDGTESAGTSPPPITGMYVIITIIIINVPAKPAV